MKKSIVSVICALTAAVGAADAEQAEMLKKFQQEKVEVRKVYNQAETTVDINAAAGNEWEVAESQLLRTLSYKLRHTEDRAERVAILQEFHRLSREIQKILDAPRDDCGRLESMFRYSRIAMLMQRMQAILLLDAESAARWKRIAGAAGTIGDCKVALQNGRAQFSAKRYDRETELEINLFPEMCFSWNGRDFALVKVDIPGSVNYDFLEVFLVEFADGKIVRSQPCIQREVANWGIMRDLLHIRYTDRDGKNCWKIISLPEFCK